MKMVFSTRSVKRGYKEDNWSNNSSFGREPPFREDLSPEIEEQPLLEAVTRQLIVETLWAGKDLACYLENVEISDDAIIKCSYE
jgi:hypothetical protein